MYSENEYDKEFYQSTITSYYKSRYRHDVFNNRARKIIREVESKTEGIRWKNVDDVIERLNAPVLLDFFINDNIHYAHYSPNLIRSPKSILKTRWGDCDELANFGRLALTKAGYNCFGRLLGGNRYPNHVGLGVELEDGSYLLAVHFDRGGNHMRGPYKTLLELDRALGHGKFYRWLREPWHFSW